MSKLDQQSAADEYSRRQLDHVTRIASGELDISARFADTRQSVATEFHQHCETLFEVLKIQVAKSRPLAIDFVKSLVPPIRAAREKLEREEITNANTFAAEFEPSSWLKVLASAEQDVEWFAERIPQIPEGNPIGGTLRQILPE